MQKTNIEADSLFKQLNTNEQEKALSILQTLDGLEVERAYWILDFCKTSIKTNAIVRI